MNLAIGEDGYLPLKEGCSRVQDAVKGKARETAQSKEGKPAKGEGKRTAVSGFTMMYKCYSDCILTFSTVLYSQRVH